MWKLAALTTLSTFMVLAFSGANVAMAVEVVDGCDVGSGPNDIDTLSASFDDGANEITVEMLLCDDPSPQSNRTKYRVHFDHTAPFFEDDDRNGDEVVDANDFCFTTSDDTMMRRRQKANNKDTGPGLIDVDGNTLTFTVPVDDLNAVLDVGDTVFIWADTHFKGINDRAPNTESGDGCSKPEVETEVLELTLGPLFKTVFVTSTTFNGNLGGVTGADDKCQTAADGDSSIVPNGTYLAWLSDTSGNSPNENFTQSFLPYVLPDGTAVATDYTDLTDGFILHGINIDETGGGPTTNTGVWTATAPNGEISDTNPNDTCNDWGTADFTVSGLLGRFAIIDHLFFGRWTQIFTDNCAQGHRLYCFQQ